MSTLKTVVNQIKSIVNSNPLYNEFGEGSIWEVDANVDIKYPLVWVDVETTPHNIQNSSVLLNVDIWFCDLVFDDESNELQIKSDTLESAVDFTKFLKDNFSNLEFYVKDGVYNAQTFSEKWNDKVAGCKLTLQLTLKGAGTNCNNIFSL